MMSIKHYRIFDKGVFDGLLAGVINDLPLMLAVDLGWVLWRLLVFIHDFYQLRLPNPSVPSLLQKIC
jgi:hypothetical protein